MKRAIGIKDVVNACLAGIGNAQLEYFDWTAGDWLWKAPEYLLTTNIAKELWKLVKPLHLALEESVKGSMTDGGAGGRGKHHADTRYNGRSDILLRWADYSPRAPIEVKNQVLNIAIIEADIKRIAKMITRKAADSTFEFGIVAFYSSATKLKNLEKKLEDIGDSCSKLVENCEISLKCGEITTLEETNDSWVACAIVIKQK